MDGGHANATINLHREFITAENIEALLAKYGVPLEPDLLSIDLDGNDYWVWKAITRYRPRVIVCEYNAALGPNAAKTVPYDPHRRWDGSSYHGASLRALHNLARQRDYSLVHCEAHGVNCFFIRDDVIGVPLWVGHPPLLRLEQIWRPGRFYGRWSMAHPTARGGDDRTWEEV